MSQHNATKRLTAPDITARKGKDPIVSLTSYHAHTAAIADKYVDFLLVVGELFTLVVYAQLVLEGAALSAAEGIDGDTVDQIFDVLVRDFSAYATTLHGKASSTPEQQAQASHAAQEADVEAALKAGDGGTVAGRYPGGLPCSTPAAHSTGMVPA